MSGTSSRALGVVLAAVVFCGCSRTYWEKDWHYDRTDQRVEKLQSITVKSIPPKAYVFLGDSEEPKGQTPLPLSLGYRVVRTELVKHKYEKRFGHKAILGTQARAVETPVPTPYLVTLTRDGFLDERRIISVPLDGEELTVSLRKTGVIEDITCRLLIEARQQYFEEIDKVIGQFAGADRELGPDEKAEITPGSGGMLDSRRTEIQQLNEQDVRVCEYNIIVNDSEKLGDLVSQLRQLATSKNFVFEIYDAQYGAKFTTNVLDTGIRHVIEGRRRTGAKLYLVQSGRARLVQEGKFVGDRFSMQVTLQPNEAHVYLVSAFKKGRAILVVYKKLNVFSQTEQEFVTEADFVTASGIDPAELTRIKQAFD